MSMLVRNISLYKNIFSPQVTKFSISLNNRERIFMVVVNSAELSEQNMMLFKRNMTYLPTYYSTHRFLLYRIYTFTSCSCYSLFDFPVWPCFPFRSFEYIFTFTISDKYILVHLPKRLLHSLNVYNKLFGRV